MHKKSGTPGKFGCPMGGEKNELFLSRDYHSESFRHETLKSPLIFEKTVSLLLHFV